jgi:hypothetical protein
MECSLERIVECFGRALRAIDRSGQSHKRFQAGIGPYGEADAIRLAIREMRNDCPQLFSKAVVKRVPDMLITGEWAIEFKIIRPFGDNGKPAEHWSENILHPYPGNTSSLGDCLKLLASNLRERKAVIVFGFEHECAETSLDPAVKSFELIAKHVLGIVLSHRIERRISRLRHPVHQVLRVFAWEVLGRDVTDSDEQIRFSSA